MFLSMNWISDFVDFTGLDKVELIHRFSLSTAEVENEIFFKICSIRSDPAYTWRCSYSSWPLPMA